MLLRELLICIIIGYCFGLIQTSYFYGKSKGIDIREHGSGNAGMTNTLRTLGTKSGIFVLVCDMLKCIVAIVLTYFLFGGNYPDAVYLIKIVTALGVILGHDFPFFMKFKGGKGIACTAGLFVAFHFSGIPVLLLSFLIPFLLTHYVSLGSLMMNVCLVVLVVSLGVNGFLHMPDAYLLATYLITMFLAALAFYQHRANIKKLLNGTERKTYLHQKGTVNEK